ncbi:60Kd inner membrane protein-domain-containing protein [Aspergillus crustosus]
MFGGPTLKGRIAQQQFAAFTRSNRSMSSFRPQISRLPVRSGKSLGGHTIWKPVVPSIGAAAAARFNSTASSPPPLNNSDIAPNTQESAGWDLGDIGEIDIAALPEKIGYLKELGLDFGWGPSSVVEFLIEHIHIWSGLPWLASIGATGILIRLTLVPFFLRAADTGAKISNAKHLTAPIRERMMAGARTGDHIETQMAKAELSKLHKDLDIKSSRAFLPILFQIPLGYGCYRVINGMTHLPVPGLAAEKFLWINDLTISDPYYLLPAITSGLLWLSLKKGGEFGSMDASVQAVRKLMLYGMPAMQFIFMAFFMPAAVQVYFAITGAMGVIQAFLLNSQSFRKSVGMTIFQDPNSGPQPGAGGATPESRSLRMLTQQLERESAHLKEVQQQQQQISLLDRTINSIRESGSELQKEASQKLNEMRGEGPKKNADGTFAPGPRLSEKDRKLAEDYEKRRKEEDDYKREERNFARREAHLKRGNARDTLKKNPKINQ